MKNPMAVLTALMLVASVAGAQGTAFEPRQMEDSALRRVGLPTRLVPSLVVLLRGHPIPRQLDHNRHLASPSLR